MNSRNEACTLKNLKYIDDVILGLKGMTVTDTNGNILSADKGLDIWTEHAKKTEDISGLTFFCGNGASATMAEHMSHDWFQNAKMNTYTCSETAHITAISNDLSYEDVFSYRIERVLSEKDILVTISSSGNSPNIVKALKTAREKGAFCITLSGMKEDNKSRQLGDLNFYVPLQYYGLVESAHAVILHAALDNFLETYMGGKH